MEKDRTVAFSDGVIAIIITILVLELKVPQGDDWAALTAIAPELYTHVLSFLYIAIHWDNHHRMMHLAGPVPESAMWPTMHWLFWLSLVPFTTAWVGESGHAALPTAVYGFSLLMPAAADCLLRTLIVRHHGPQSDLARTTGRDIKGKAWPLAYAVAIPFAFVRPWIADVLYTIIALACLVPERRFARVLRLG
jgi:uncharacterized membrane protein